MDLILASTSPWRLSMLRDAGIRVRGVPPEVTEESDLEDPRERAIALAERKARAVHARYPGAWVLGADQVVHDGREIFGKPIDEADRFARLAAMRGRAHRLVSGFALVGPDFVETGSDVTILHVRADLSDDELRAYAGDEDGRGCAGGYAAEGRGVFLFERIEGDFFNVLGLPLLQVMGALRRRGWRFGEGR